MATESRPFRHALEYWFARGLVFLLAFLPIGLAGWIGRRLGEFFHFADKRHRERARDAVRDRLGLDENAARDFVKRNFHHYGMTLAEFARLSRMRAEDFHRYVELGPLTQCVAGLLAEGRGLLFITAHFGNWEWCNSTGRAMGLSGGSIARPLDNPRLNEYIRGIRERNGLRIFDKQGAIRKALGALRDNQTVGILIDQDAGGAGMMSPFLGKAASTLTVPVELAIRTGSPMLVVGMRRGGESGKRFTMLFNPTPHRSVPGADPAAETRRLVDALNEDLGGLIMQAPDQWFWIHRRWKSIGRRV